VPQVYLPNIPHGHGMSCGELALIVLLPSTRLYIMVSVKVTKGANTYSAV
jgi:hypothetical protein